MIKSLLFLTAFVLVQDVWSRSTIPEDPSETPTYLPTEDASGSTWTTNYTDSTIESITKTSLTTLEDSCEYLDNGCPADFDIHKLLAHETSCRKYYHCVRGERVLKRCAQGLVFNPTIENCDHARNVDHTCEEEGSSEEDESLPKEDEEPEEIELLPNGCPVNHTFSMYLPHEYYCNVYYQCAFGEKLKQRCPDGTHFNPEAKNCDYIFKVNCNLPGGDLIETSTTTEASTSPTIELRPNGCPVNSSIPWLVANENDCTKFYYCTFNGLHAASCIHGLYFNPILQICDNPASAGCAADPCGNNKNCTNTNSTTESTTTSPTDFTSPLTTNTTDLPTDFTTESTGNFTTPTTNTTTNTTVAPAVTTTAATPNTTSSPSTIEDSCEYLDNGCPADFDIHQLLAHETSCRKFYFCVRGERVLRKCAKGLFFNPVIENCDHSFNVDRTCEDEESSEEDDSLPEEDKEPEEIELLPNGCPVNHTISMYLPHEYYCNIYYQCVFGQKIDRYCPGGTHFNQEIQNCDHIPNANCRLPGGDYVTTTTTATPTEATTGPPIDLLPNGCPRNGSIDWLVPHENCTKFYICVWSSLVEMDCPGGTHFNPVEQFCDNPATAGCKNKCNKPCGSCSDGNEGCDGNEGNDNGNSGDEGNGNGGSGNEGNDNGGSGDDGNGNGGSGNEGNDNGSSGDDGNGNGGSGNEGNDNGGSGDDGNGNGGSGNEGNDNGGSGDDGNGNGGSGNEGNDNGGSGDDGNGNGGSGDGGNGNGDSGDGGNGNGDNGDGGNGNGDGGNGNEDNGDGGNGNGDEGIGNGGSGDDGNGNEGSGDEGNGNGGSGDEGNGNGGSGDEGNDNGGSGDDGNGNEGNGDEGNGNGGSGDEENDNGGSDDDGNGNEGSGDEGNGNEDNGDGGNGNEDNGDGGNGNEDNGDGGNGNEDNGDEGNGNGGSGDDGNGNEGSGDEGNGNGGSSDEGNGSEDSGDGGNGNEDNGDGGNGDEDSGDEGNDDGDSGDGGNGNEDSNDEENGNGGSGDDQNDEGNGNDNDDITSIPDASTEVVCDGADDEYEAIEDKKCKNECNILPSAHQDCDKYWICHGKKAVLVVCSEGLHFNPSTSTCDFPCNAGCERKEVQATTGHDGLKLFLPWNKIDKNTMSLIKLMGY